MLNLLPPELRAAQHYAARNRSLLALGSRLALALGLVLAVFVLQLILLNHQHSSIQTSLDTQKSQLSSYADLENQAEGANQRLTQLQAIVGGHVHWEKFFAELGTRTPSGVYITSINAGLIIGNITIAGSARSEEQISSLVSSLRTWPALSSVSLQSVSPDSDAVGFAHNAFGLNAAIKPEALK